MKAIQVQKVGDPDVLQYVDAPTPEPGAGEARVKIEVAGVNFIDTYHRRGWYPLPLPFTPGVEGAGIVDAVGEGVTEVAVGDAVAYGMSTTPMLNMQSSLPGFSSIARLASMHSTGRRR